MKIRNAAPAALALAAALALTGCANVTGSGSAPMPGMNHGSTLSPSAEEDFTHADPMFVRMMIPHHQQAVDMADTILAKEDIDARVITLAEDIKAAQQPEIDQMEEWLEAWGADMGGMNGDMDGMDHGGGMMSEDDMAELAAATGAEAARLFLEQMTEHHEGAIDMAQDELDNGQNADVLELARTIIDTQTAEIAVMRQLLAEL